MTALAYFTRWKRWRWESWASGFFGDHWRRLRLILWRCKERISTSSKNGRTINLSASRLCASKRRATRFESDSCSARVSRAGDGILAIAVWSNFDDPSALLQGIRWFWHHAANKIMGERQNRFTGLGIEIISQRH